MRLKHLLFIAFFMLAANFSKATVWLVTVANFQFSPANLNVIVGDTVKWTYISGFHNTTSTSVPAGAATWTAPMQKSTDVFQYTITVAGDYKYFCSIHPTSMLGTIKATSSLPVVLANFSVSASQTGGNAVIKWTTTTESNTAVFTVKKSTNAADFTEVASVKASGTTSQTHTYTVTDNNIGTQFKYIYYMISITDKDGSSTFSPVERFTNNASVTKLVTQLSANPVPPPGHIMFQFNADKEDAMLVQLIDNKGKLVSQAMMHADKGLNNGHFHAGNIAAGLYTLVFSMDGIKETYKIVMQ